MRKLRLVTRAPSNTTRMPASAYIIVDPYPSPCKDCLDEQTTLGGKIHCIIDHMVALSDKSQL